MCEFVLVDRHDALPVLEAMLSAAEVFHPVFLSALAYAVEAAAEESAHLRLPVVSLERALNHISSHFSRCFLINRHLVIDNRKFDFGFA